MSADWWAYGLGTATIVVAFGGFIWLRFEWWATGRTRMRVIASAGSIQSTPHGLMILRGERFGESAIIVDAINTSRRDITVKSLGFVERPSRHRHILMPLPGQRFPTTLNPGQNVWLSGNPEGFLEALRSGARLVPFCEDAEGKMHKGKEDEHFRRFARRATEATDT